MTSRTLAAAIVAVCLVIPVRAAAADDSATLLRVFLTDGTSLVSYGEPARVADRVIFSMPTGTTPNPPLHLVNLPIARVDWDRTSRYAATARETRYVQTQADADYAALSNDVSLTLDEVARTTDPRRRLAIVERARTTLAEWPQNHFNYRQAEVRQMLSMLDEAIADLQAATGRGRFTLTLSAFVDPPAIVEPLLPPPTPREAIEQVLVAARVVDTPAERTSLLATAVAAIDREDGVVPADWAATTRAEAEAEIVGELRVDRSYQSLTAQMMWLANRRARAAARAGAVNALVAAVEESLVDVRRLRLPRDRFALRASVLHKYNLAKRA